MSTRKCFTVTNPLITFRLLVCTLCFFIILVVLNILFTPPPHTAMYICTTVFVFIPLTFLILWTKMYKIRVNGSKISVRKGLGLVKFSFVITDIRNVQWKVRKNRFAQNEVITVFTAQGKQFKVESLMVNADNMQAFLKDHVEENKIKRMGSHHKQSWLS